MKVINITFHGIGRTPEDIPPEEKEVWLQTEQFESILNIIHGHKNIYLMVDDGNYSDVEIILPALLSRNLKATLFVPVKRIGAKGYVSESDLRKWAAANFKVGSHGLTHRDWRKFDDIELAREVCGSKDRIEQILGCPIVEASCPLGSYDRRVLRHLRKAGYKRVYTSDRGLAVSGAWLQPRNTLYAWDDQYSVQRMLSKSSLSPDFLLCRLKTLIKRLR